MWQPAEGPRVSMDTVLLAGWVRTRARRTRFVELGSAAGAVSLMLALRFPALRVTGVEIQGDLVDLALRNRVENGAEDRVSFVRGDLRDEALLPRESFDGLVVNPPYEDRGRGRVSPVAARSIARHGVDPASGADTCSLDDVALAALRLLKGRGRLFAVFRADRLAAFVGTMLARSLAPIRLRMIHPRRERPANLFLVECVKDAEGRGRPVGLTVEPPLVVQGDDGEYTPDLLRAYEL